MSERRSSQNALERVDSFQYPAAHLGHLNQRQQEALDAFKELCTKESYFRPQAEGSTASHDDETLLRYLRARRFNPKEAFGQFKETEDWRRENRLEELYDTIDVNEYDETRRLYPQWTGRRDKRGIPVYVYEVAPLNSKAMAAYDASMTKSSNKTLKSSKVPPKMLRLFALYENLTRFIMPLCSAVTDREHPETPISQSNNIVDISRVGLKQFWNLKSHMQDASTLATAHYPETLDRIFIIGAPVFFPTVWGWIKRWFDPVTVSKIFILSQSDMKNTLEKYIDPANIPKKYGGELDFEFGMMPIIEPAIERAILWEHRPSEKGHLTVPTGPIKWIENDDGTVQCIAVGTKDGKPRHEVLGKLPPGMSLRNKYGNLVNTNVPISESELNLASTGVSTHAKVGATAEAQASATIPPPDSGTLIPPSEPTPPRLTSPGATTTMSTSTAPSSAPLQNPPPTSTTSTSDLASTPQLASVTHQTANMSLNEPRAQNPTGTGTVTTEPADRVGTSHTRMAEQAGTHAEGQMAEGTPAVTDRGAGDKHVQMESATIGQAPKDLSEPVGKMAEFADTSIVGQAQAAVQKVKEAVGLGEKKEEPKVEEKKEDERVDQAEDLKVEEYLRSQVGNVATDSKK